MAANEKTQTSGKFLDRWVVQRSPKVLSSQKSKIDLSWYLKRLSKMPFREIPYRLAQVLSIKRDKYFSRGVDCRQIDYVSKVSELALFSSNKWLSDYLDSQAIRQEMAHILRHEFEIFGIKKSYGSDLDFHQDPKTGKSWPLIFWGDINYRNSHQIGGIKFAWELNRFHHWPKLALAYIANHDQIYLKECFDELKHWLETNPYPYGINWISSIELGIRLVNLLFFLKIVGSHHFNEEGRRLLARFVYLHARHLCKYRSKYSSCANHAISEALGLFAAGLMFPAFTDASKWKTLGRRVLEKEAARQILEDGSSFEHSIPYLQFVADHLLVYHLWCKEYQEPMNHDIERRLIAICDFLVTIMDLDGNVPLFGDDDDGFLLKTWSNGHNNFLSLINTGSILFGRPHWIHPSASLDTKTTILLGRSAPCQWKLMQRKRDWNPTTRYFPNAGLGVIRHGSFKQEILFVGNSGPLGLPPLGGHGHADALSFWLSVNGQPFFVDPGTYLYHSGGKWRHYFRSTAAHNSVQIDDQDQAEQLGDFMFGDFYQINNINWREDNESVCWAAEHDGYARLPDPVLHRREVCYFKRKRSFEIVDLLNCNGWHKIKILFHLHPNVEVRSEGENRYCLSVGSISVILHTDKQLKGQVLIGSEDPLMGWYSPKFNRLEKTISLVFSKKIRGNSIFRSEVNIL